MAVAVINLLLTISEEKSKVKLISEISEFSYLALRQIRKLGKIILSFRKDLNFICNCDLQWLQLFSCVSRVFQSKRVKSGSFPRNSEFSFLALGEIRKLGKIFLSFRNDLNFICNCDLQWLQLFSCVSRLCQNKYVKLC